MVFTFHRILYAWLRPAIIAVFGRNIPWAYRWRLLLLQPIHILANTISVWPYIFSRPFTVEWLPIYPGLTLRAAVFNSKRGTKSNKLRPLHLNIHGGAFLGGLPEMDGKFCNLLAEKTGAVVVSTSYRYAPEHPFPTAIDDIDAVVRYLQKTAADKYGADPTLMTVSGFSAGGNLAFALCQQETCHEPAPTAIKGIVTSYAVMECRITPEQKPRPPGFPNKDPLGFLFPLFDAYGASVREENINNPRLSPILAPIETLPKDILMIIPTMDILLNEQLTFIKRVQEEAKPDLRLESKFFEGQIHGWDKLPETLMGPTGSEADEVGVSFLKEVYRKHGFVWDN